MAAINRRRDVARRLASATCTLLGAAPASAGLLHGWDVETAVLHYQEADDRVSAVEPVVSLKRAFSGNRALKLKLAVDVLTGSTPNGAVPSRTPQTYTTPSGASSYDTAPGETPLDDTFIDTRVAFTADWEQPLARLSKLSFGIHLSEEEDFRSIGGNVIVSRDFNERNTTLTLGISGEHDTIGPVGNVPIPFAAMGVRNGIQPRMGETDDKTVLDLLAGVTQVIDRRTVAQLNYSLSRSNGYLNEPYKVISVVDPNTAATTSNLFENRPDDRAKHAFYGLLRRRLARDVVSGSYRYFFDDWGIRSHTVDLTYHWKPATRWWLEPHFRFYSQTEADFYRVQLLQGDPLPGNASADYRLSAFRGYTFGLRYGWIFRNASELVLKAEYYLTRGDDEPAGILASQRGLDFYPDLRATIFQVQYRF